MVKAHREAAPKYEGRYRRPKGQNFDGLVQPADEFLGQTSALGQPVDHVQVASSSNAGNAIEGTEENDLLLGDIGHDVLMGGAGDDVLRGGYEDDIFHGGPGDD